MKAPRNIGLACTLVGFILGLTAATAPRALNVASVQNFYHIQNRFRPEQYLHTERGPLESGPIVQGWWSADWIMEPVADAPGFVRFRNRFRSNVILHTERGPIEATPGEPGWWSAHWQLQPVPGTDFVRIRNRFRPTSYLHSENGPLVCGPAQEGWWSGHWRVTSNGAAVATNVPTNVPTTTPTQTQPNQGATTPPPNRGAHRRGTIARPVVDRRREPRAVW
jgi:hypothetical protein